jgi:ArsR family metal-binding transcriptional regulator
MDYVLRFSIIQLMPIRSVKPIVMSRSKVVVGYDFSVNVGKKIDLVAHMLY